MMTDPIVDMLARIRNAALARHQELVCPSSNLRLAFAQVLVDAGFLEHAQVEAREGRPALVMRVRYGSDGRSVLDGLRRVSRPSRRVYHLYGRPTDMRKSFDGLYAVTRQEMGLDPLSGRLFVFINRRATQMKVLYFDRSGLCVWSNQPCSYCTSFSCRQGR